MIVGVIKVEVDIVNAESKWYGLWLWKGEEDNNKEGKQEQEKEERAEWYGSWPSEKEDSGVWKKVKPVCAKLTVQLGARLNCEVQERCLDACLWCRARR